MANPFFYSLAMMKRGEIRERFGIKGSGMSDCCATYWCPCCALIQQDNEVKARLAQGPVTQGYQSQKEGMHVPAPTQQAPPAQQGVGYQSPPPKDGAGYQSPPPPQMAAGYQSPPPQQGVGYQSPPPQMAAGYQSPPPPQAPGYQSPPHQGSFPAPQQQQQQQQQYNPQQPQQY